MNTQPLTENSAGRRAGRERLAATFKQGELVWLAGEEYDPELGFWHFDVLRGAANGRWVRQRYRFDEAADVQYFLGETLLSEDEFRAARGTSTQFARA